MLNQSGDEYSKITNFNSFLVSDVSINQYVATSNNSSNNSLKNQTYLQPIKLFQQQQQQQSQPLVPQTQSSQQYQLHQFKSISINDEIISPLSNSSSTSSSSSMSFSSSSSSSASSCNASMPNETSASSVSASATPKDKTKLKIKSLNENYVSAHGKTNQKKFSNKKKASQMANDLDEERTSQLVSELLRNIKEKTKQLESLNQHMKSNHSSSNNNNTNSNSSSNSNDSKTKSNDLIANSPVNNTSFSEAIPNLATKPFSASSNKRSRNKLKKQSLNSTSTNNNNATSQFIAESKEIRVPSGWQRLAENSSIVYKSPSGCKFHCFQDIRAYLLESDTCKCGLECPLNIYETFNFDINIRSMPLSSLSDLSNKLTSCCWHKTPQVSSSSSDNHKQDDLNSKKRKINDENHKLVLDSNSAASLVYQFHDDLIVDAPKLDSAEFSLIQLNHDSDLNTNDANLILEANYLNLNDDLDLMHTTGEQSDLVKQRSDNDASLQQLINHDLLMSSSLSSSSLTNTPVIVTPHSSTSMDFSSTSMCNANSKNIFNFYTSADEKSNYAYDTA